MITPTIVRIIQNKSNTKRNLKVKNNAMKQLISQTVPQVVLKTF